MPLADIDAEAKKNGEFEVGYGKAHVIGRGPLALAFLVVIGLFIALGSLIYTNNAGFANIQHAHEVISNDIGCLIWVIADEHSRKRMIPPPCVNKEVVP